MAKVLSIIINNNKIRIAQVKKTRRGITVGQVIERELPLTVVDDSTIINPTELAKFLRSLLKVSNIKTRNVIFTLPSDKVMTRETIFPAMKDEDIRLAIRTNASEYFPIDLAAYDLGYFKIAKITPDSGDDAAQGMDASQQDAAAQNTGAYGPGTAPYSDANSYSGASDASGAQGSYGYTGQNGYAGSPDASGMQGGYGYNGQSMDSYSGQNAYGQGTGSYAGQNTYGQGTGSYGDASLQGTYGQNAGPYTSSSSYSGTSDASGSPNSYGYTGQGTDSYTGQAAYGQTDSSYPGQNDYSNLSAGSYGTSSSVTGPMGMDSYGSADAAQEMPAAPDSSVEQPDDSSGDASEEGLSKKELAKRQKSKEKAEKAAEKEAKRLEKQKKQEEAKRNKKQQKAAGKSKKDKNAPKEQLRVMVVAAPDQVVLSYYDIAEIAHLHVQSVDFIGNSVFQITANQISEEPNLVIQLDMDHTVVSIFDRDVMVLQRHVDFACDSLIDTVMQERNISRDQALSDLQTSPVLHDNFGDKDNITEALYYLVGNVRRTMDYYAGRNSKRPLQKIYLMGDAIYFKGIRELFENELNLPVDLIDSLQDVTVASKADNAAAEAMKYLDNIGAVIAPIGFVPHEVENITERARVYSNYRVTILLSVFAGLVIVTVPLLQYFNVSIENMNLQRKLDETDYVEPIVSRYNAAKQKYSDVQNVDGNTASNTEELAAFLDIFEQIRPSDVALSEFTCQDGAITMQVTASGKEDIATLIQQLQTLDNIRDISVSGLSSIFDEEGTEAVTTTLTCTLVNPAKEEYDQQQYAQSADGGIPEDSGDTPAASSDGTEVSAEDSTSEEEIQEGFYNTTVNESDVPSAFQAGS